MKKQKSELESVVSVRKLKKRGKRVAVTGQILLTRFELHQAVAQAERDTKSAKQRRMKKQKGIQQNRTPDIESEEELLEASDDEIEDCIEVAQA